MKENKADLSVLKGAIIVFVISLALSSGLIWSGWYFKEKMHSEFNKSKALQRSVAENYVAIDQEKVLINKFLPAFRRLHAMGVFGQEQRLNWIETLRNSGERLKLPALRYEIDSQDLYSPTYQVNTGPFMIYASPMTLNLELVHEIDLLDILQDLDRNADGIYNLNSCNLNRRSAEINRDKLESYVIADCELMWFNIKKPDGSSIEL